MKKLGIFGDSNAFYNLKGYFKEPKHYWQHMLAEKLGVDFDCFGLNGSSLYYSYNKLKSLKNFNDYEYVVFIETQPGRLYIGGDLEERRLVISEPFLEKLRQQDFQQIRPSFHFDIIEAGDKYFKFLRQENFDQDIHNLLVKEVYNLLSTANKKFVIQPVAPIPYTNISKPTYPTDVNFFLSDIVSKQYSVISKKESEKYNQSTERLTNHLTPKNNETMANYYFDLLTIGTSKISINDFEIFPEPIDQWFWPKGIDK
jgi:hypothetical protein